MLFPHIVIKDKTTGETFSFGKSPHDTLIVKDGTIRYFNLQNCCGSGPNGTYEIIANSDDDFTGACIPLVEIEDLQHLDKQSREEQATLDQSLREHTRKHVPWRHLKHN